jgi:hypothetical protein
MQFINDDWLVYDDYFLFDGSADIQDNIFIKGGSNVLEIGKFNQDLHVPGLVGKILRGEVIQQRKFIK